MKINFNKISDAQYIRIFNGKIISAYETIRNNMIIGRSINSGWTLPTSWKIEIPIWTGKTLNSSYSVGGSYTNYPEVTFSFKAAEWISKIHCYTSIGTITNSISSWTWVIFINKDIISFSGTTDGVTPCNTTSTKRIILETKYHGNTGSIEINGLSWVVTSSY